MVAYSPLLKGGYVSQGKLDAAEFAEFDHPGTPVRLAALPEVAKDAGATVNQVVLAWLISAEVSMIPLVGASSVAQLDESLAAVDLELTAEQRARLDAARRPGRQATTNPAAGRPRPVRRRPVVCTGAKGGPRVRVLVLCVLTSDLAASSLITLSRTTSVRCVRSASFRAAIR
jgi:Aldo/keto reductase family